MAKCKALTGSAVKGLYLVHTADTYKTNCFVLSCQCRRCEQAITVTHFPRSSTHHHDFSLDSNRL